jgi:hypothetical protein
MFSFGTLKKNLEPLPLVDSNHIEPSRLFTILLHIARPIPFPGNSFLECNLLKI